MDYHLVILVHGLWGNLTHFNYVQSQLELSFNQDENQKERLFVYKTGSNEGYKTYDGIDICGKRVASEIEAQILLLNDSGGSKVVKISVIGYSLGGLIARYAIGILYYKGYFKDIEPVNFCSICSPHVGTLTPGRGVSIKFFNYFAPLFVGNSGKQIFLKDKTKVSNHIASSGGISRTNSIQSLNDSKKQQEYQPLLVLMANPASIFYKSLKSFKYRALYSNVVNDKRTSWWTSGISIMNPFEVLDVEPTIKIDHNGVIDFHNGTKFKFSFQDDYSPIVLDSSKPLKILNHVANQENGIEEVESTYPNKEELISNNEMTIAADYAENFFKRKFKWLIVIFNIVILGPMWFILMVLTSLLEGTKSGIRVLKESDAGSVLELYHLVEDDIDEKDNNTNLLRPSLSRTLSETYDNFESKLEQNLQDQTEGLMESVWDAMMSKKINNEEDQFWFNNNKSNDNDFQNDSQAFITTLDELANGRYKDEKLASKSPDRVSAIESIYNILDNFKLNFNTDAQLEIIKNLNTLNWKKIPIYIQLTDHTHAAAIVRHKDRNFKEGEVVVRHLCNETFKLH